MTALAPAPVRVGGQVVELTAPMTIEMREHAVPEPLADEVVVAVAALGLCGTDLHLYAGRGATYPWVVGHDAAGVVHAVGSAVSGFDVGQRVAVDPVLHCGQCAACLSGRVQLCRVGGYLGMLGPGMAAQYVALPARQLLPLPDAVSDLAATALEPLAVALHTLRRVQPLMPEPGPAVVIGGGPLGLLQAQVMQHFGWKCSVFEPEPQRRELGTRLGLDMFDVHETGHDEGDDPAPRLVVETSAAGAGVDLAERQATPGSVIAMVGRGPHSVAPASILLKELSLVGVKGGPRCYGEAVDLVSQGVIDPTAVITHQFGWNHAAEAFAQTTEQPDSIVRSALYGEW